MMIRTIARYGARHVPGSQSDIKQTFLGPQAVQGPAISEFEEAFARYHGVPHAITASYGRMAFYYILKSMDFPPNSEIIVPALTFWVVPEIARVAGLRPVFVDINPYTFNIDPEAIERAVNSNTVAILPTHLYGQPCEMDSILRISRKYDLRIIEDCAHAIGATYKGQKTGTFGDAAFFSFQMLKGLNTYGGGMAITANDELAERIRKLAEAEPWPKASDVRKKFLLGTLQRAFISSYGFTFSMFVPFYIASFFGNHDLTRYIWEKIRPLNPFPDSYRRRYTNAQAVMGLKGLEALDSFNAKCRANGERLTEGLKEIRSILPPATIEGSSPVYYQYCIRVSEPAKLSQRAIRKGVDLEIMHVDICNKLELFAPAPSCPAAESTEGTLQLPVYSGLSPQDVDRVLRVIRQATHDMPAIEQIELKEAHASSLS